MKSIQFEILSAAKLKKFSSLLNKKYRNIEKLFIVEGKKPCYELNATHFPVHCIITSSNYLGEIPDLKCNYYKVDEHVFKKLSDLENPEGILAILEHVEFEIDTVDLNQGQFIATENIQDPGNLGTIIRIADWFGFKGVICSLDTVDCYNPKTIRSSMGSVLRIPVFYPKDFYGLLSANENKLIVSHLDGYILKKENIDSRNILVLGNESKGISEKINGKKYKIEGFGTAESLNVAIATGIFAYVMKN